jgi:hypothetical protein
MPKYGIGIGIDEAAIIALMRDLSIKPDRMEFLVDLLNSGTKTGNPVDEIQRFIATSTKANEVAFLCFLCGFGYGIAHALQHAREDIEKAAKIGVLVGAEHSEEVKQIIQEMGINSHSTEVNQQQVTAKKKDEKEEDRMYG